MKQTLLLAVLLLSLPLAAQQERGSWRAESNTARSITGDIGLEAEKLWINFSGFPAANIRPLKPAEVSALFDPADNASGRGTLYRISIPADKKFLHHNTLCGADETQWFATYVLGRTLQVAFFSGASMPVFTTAALANSPNLCGTYTYTRFR